MMSDEDLSRDHIAVAWRIHEKVHFYLIALSFTLAGLAVETASFDQSVLVHTFELLGWIFLIASGLLGISRARVVESHFGLQARRLQNFATIKAITGSAARGTVHGPGGEVHSPEHTYAKTKVEYDAYGELMEKEGKIMGRKWKIQKWTFLAGIAALVLSRGWPGITSIGQWIAERV